MEITFFNPLDVKKNCGIETNAESDLDEHIKKTHWKRFPCDFCYFTAKVEGC